MVVGVGDGGSRTDCTTRRRRFNRVRPGAAAPLAFARAAAIMRRPRSRSAAEGEAVHFDASNSERILALLREWGWEGGLQRLRAEVDGAAPADDRADAQFFLAWMAAERGGHDDADRRFRDLEAAPGLAGWAAYGQAFVA